MEGFLWTYFAFLKDDSGSYEENMVEESRVETGSPVRKLEQWSRQEMIRSWSMMVNRKGGQIQGKCTSQQDMLIGEMWGMRTKRK